MGTELITVRKARAGDEQALADIHENSWRSAYQGIIPHPHLERMLVRRGVGWWQRQIERRADVMLLVFDDVPQGYASVGVARGAWPWPAGEIFELYLSPPFQGVGLGRKLFDACRAALKAEGLPKLVVWVLEDNAMACGFYQRLGGRVVATAPERYGSVALKRIAFLW